MKGCKVKATSKTTQTRARNLKADADISSKAGEGK